MTLQYIPARDSRHRTACFALYKALLKQVPAIVLPAQGTSLPGDRVNPVRHLIRKSFRRNKNETSRRLVVSCLSNGYKFLHLLNGAKIPASPEHKTVIDLIERNTSRRKPPTPRNEPTPEPPRKHLLTRHPNPAYDPDEWFEMSREPRFFYSPTDRPRPAEELGGSGIRRVPYVVSTATHDPFLRITKPEPISLSMAIRGRIKQKQRWADFRIDSFEYGGKRLAQLEDQWEDLVAGGPGLGAAADGGATYVETIMQSLRYLKRVEELDYLDKLHRAAALDQIESQERKLAEEEAAAREEAARENGATENNAREAAAIDNAAAENVARKKTIRWKATRGRHVREEEAARREIEAMMSGKGEI
ncbi:hypothetical protein PpBr36_03846 [Pyricularia pennisetigena]|uniref:hypothetical protein n=1 Tax=Pyricularia pennisetigena TaxID=1578925 RepID=UPI00114F91A9|nr:hypothetical protein PpBr36_03846 [Pyricularia pennisetigena]TLS30101.1 hypothetical protein PpBr36_03846 [Pyricularia pennisetigena]